MSGARGQLVGVLLVGIVAVAAIVALNGDDPGGVAVDETVGSPRAVPPDEEPAASDLESVAEASPVGPTVPLGVVDGLTLAVPGADPVVVAYHEASFPEAMPVAPAGVLVSNENPTRFTDPGPSEGPDYAIQVSRGRIQGPTTAIDVMLTEDTPVLAPVSGTVTDVRPYELYGRHEDVRLEITPEGRPDLRVVLIHVDGVRVAQGATVTAGEPIADRARLFPFEAVVDRLVAPARHGHVHIEVKTPTEEPSAAPSDAAG